MLDRDSMIEIVKNHTSPSPRGCSCYFIQLDDNWGIKVYGNGRECEQAYERQKRMYSLGFAPEVGAMFAIGYKSCYVTEVAEPVVVGDKMSLKQWSILEQKARDKNPYIDEEIADLTEKMSDADYHMDDCHYGNFGYLRGTLVAIDFGN